MVLNKKKNSTQTNTQVESSIIKSKIVRNITYSSHSINYNKTETQKNLFGHRVEKLDTISQTNNDNKNSNIENKIDNKNSNSNPKTFKDEIKTIQKSLIPTAKTGEEFKTSWYYLVLGFCMGIVDAIPGISGSTVSLIAKQYEFIMRTFSKILSKHFFNQGIKSLKETIKNSSLKGVYTYFYEFKLYIPFLLILGILSGILLSFVTIAKLIENYESTMMKLFFIFTLCVVIYYIYLHKNTFKEHYKTASTMVTFSISLFVILTLLSYYSTNSLSTISTGTFFIAGIISMIAMLLPGLSGSLVLLLLGVYVPLKNALLGFEIYSLIAFIIGAIIGGVSSIKGIAYLSSNYSIHIKFFILSVLIASTINLWLIAY
ncbi:MAG: DUF368 domain-containing protein [Nanoarchaeota archaeon]|nr:DUF368 domain-containing protein [Nanoarchaeota archaeon]